MRFFKRLLRILFLFLILAAVGLAVMYHLSTRAPDGYTPSLLTAAQRAEASRSVDTQKIPMLLNLAADAHRNASASLLAQSGKAVPPDATQPVKPLTVSFTQDELNATLWKWSEPYKATYETYLTNPFILLEEGAVVLMGTAPEFGRVASAYFEPKLDENGLLRCDLTSLKVGSLPLPESLLSKQRTKLEQALKAQLPAWQDKAKIDPAGVANSDAKAAALSKLVLRLLNREPSPPVIFLPHGNNASKTVPVRLTNVTVEKGVLSITIQPMNPDERAALLDQIRKPQQSASADTAKS